MRVLMERGIYMHLCLRFEQGYVSWADSYIINPQISEKCRIHFLFLRTFLSLYSISPLFSSTYLNIFLVFKFWTKPSPSPGMLMLMWMFIDQCRGKSPAFIKPLVTNQRHNVHRQELGNTFKA